MKRILQSVIVVLTFLTSSIACAQTAADGNQDMEALRQSVTQFLATQATGISGQTSVTVLPINRRTPLAACPAPEMFMPTGGRTWGKTSVGVRCLAPVKWTIYVKATVKVTGDYVAAALPLAQGHVITDKDLATVRGDLTSLPSGIITNPAEAIGRRLSMSIPLGAPIRKDLLRNQQAVQSGQSVRLVSTGNGFKVSTEGRAMNNANEGQVVQSRTASGQIVSGIARMGGIVEISF